MTDSVVVYSTESVSDAAGRHLAEQISAHFKGAPPDAVVVFASAVHDYEALLRAVSDRCHPRHLVGASSAGEFTNQSRGEGSTCALALRSDELKFSTGVGRAISKDRADAAAQLASGFKGVRDHAYPYRCALVMSDALAGHADDLVDQLTLATGGTYQFFGGGAGDDARFQRTHVFHGTEVMTDAVVALEMLSLKPVGVGVGHGWKPASPPLRVTEANGMQLKSLNGLPAIAAFEEHAKATGQKLDIADPMPFFLHNIIGVESREYRLRVPLAVNEDGSMVCAADIPTGAIVHIMKTSSQSAIDAGGRCATKHALSALRGHTPQVALFFDCVATRLRMGDVFGFELKSVADLLHGAAMVGCNTYGQIARADGQFSGFHNCTAVVCVLPA